jgi:hypothetical protein
MALPLLELITTFWHPLQLRAFATREVRHSCISEYGTHTNCSPSGRAEANMAALGLVPDLVRWCGPWPLTGH